MKKNEIIEFPFQQKYLEYINSRTNGEKLHLFKNWLESYIKFNLAIHVSWILKNKNNNVHHNLRVMVVQLFQKPPSIGFCFSISKFINKEIINDNIEDSIWTKWAIWIEQREPLFSRFIELRNKDAHSGSALSDNELIEIELGLQDLLSSPILNNGVLICSNYKELIGANIQLPDGIENLNIPFILIKEVQYFISDVVALDGSELLLFPLIIPSKQEIFDVNENYEFNLINRFNEDFNTIENSVDQPLSMLFWNKRISVRGLYSSYLNSEINNIELNNILDISGFPYEDWKRSADPIFLKYLESRNKVLDEMLNDRSITIEVWYNEYLVAKRLENEFELKEYEKITLSEYVRGILIKLSNETDKYIYETFHKHIFELQKVFDNVFENERTYLADKIMESSIFLFDTNVKRNDVEQYNFYYNRILKFVPSYFYEGFNPIKVLLSIVGGEEGYSVVRKKLFNIRLLTMMINIMIILLLLNFFNGLTLYFLYFILFVLNYIRLLYLTTKYYQFSNLIFNTLKSIKFIRKNTFKVMPAIMKGFELNIIHNSNSQNSELAHVLALSIPEAKVDFKNRSILSKISFAMSLALIDMNDFQIIVYRYKFLKYLLTSKESTIHGERKEDLIECLCESFKSFSSLKLMGDLALYDILNEDRIRYKQGDFSNLSRTQRNYCLKKLNEIVYFENLIRCIDMVTNKYKYFVSKNDFISDNSRMMDLTFYGESKFQNSEYLNYNYLLAFIAAYCDELDKSLIFFKIANENAKAEWKIFINWNLAQIYGALGHVRDYVISYYNMQSDLKNLNEEQHRKLGTWVIEDIEINCKKIIENFNRNNYEISDLSDLNTMVFSMVFSKSKFNLSFEPNLLPNQMKNIQINKKIG